MCLNLSCLLTLCVDLGNEGAFLNLFSYMEDPSLPGIVPVCTSVPA